MGAAEMDLLSLHDNKSMSKTNKHKFCNIIRHVPNLIKYLVRLEDAVFENV